MLTGIQSFVIPQMFYVLSPQGQKVLEDSGRLLVEFMDGKSPMNDFSKELILQSYRLTVTDGGYPVS